MGRIVKYIQFFLTKRLYRNSKLIKMSCSPFHIQCLRSLPLLSIFFNAFIAISQNFDPYQVAIPGAEDPLEMAPVSGGTFQMGSV